MGALSSKEGGAGCWVGVGAVRRPSGPRIGGVAGTGHAGEALLLLPSGGAYFGDLLGGLCHGFGIELAAEGELYEGEWRRGIRHGTGRESNASGSAWSGPFAEGLRHGEGLAVVRDPEYVVFRQSFELGRLVFEEEVPEEELRPPAPSGSQEKVSTGDFCLPAVGLGAEFALATATASSLPKRHPVSAWDEDEVECWLRANGFRRLVPAFREAHITGEQLLGLDHPELEVLHVLRYGSRCRLLHAVRRAVVESSLEPRMRGGTRPGNGKCTAPSPLPQLFIPCEQLQLGPPLASPGVVTGDVTRKNLGWYLGKDVVVQLFRGRSLVDTSGWHRAVGELATLRHPGLALFLGVAAWPQGCCAVSEYASGTSLRAWLERPTVSGSPVVPGLPVLLRVARGIAATMSYLHSRSVWHLRLCPQCVFLDDQLEVKVADYSLATLEAMLCRPRMHRLRGCSPWTPPEVLLCVDYPPRSTTDVYAFGVILWELLARRPPFEGLTRAQLVVAVGYAGRRLPRLRAPPPGLWALSRSCLRREACRRPPFTEVAAVLTQLEAGGSAAEDALDAFFRGA